MFKILLHRPITLALVIGIAYLAPAARLPASASWPAAPPLVEYRITLHSDGQWTSETHVAARAASLMAGASAVLGDRGDDPRQIVQAVLDTMCVYDQLTGPVALNLGGTVRAGDLFSLTLPGNPSTGYSWEVVDRTAVSQIGEVELRPIAAGLGAPVRQIIRLRATETGQAAVRLRYQRPWEDVPPAQVITVQAKGLDLAGTCAALSLPLPPLLSAPVVAVADTVSSSAAALPSAFNWCDQKGCTPVRDQGVCGSCWAFATTGVLESAIRIQHGLSVDLSEQYLVSCNAESPKWGCDGGWFAHEYHWRKQSLSGGVGAVLESEFPYQVRDDIPCGGPYSHPYRISSWAYIENATSIPSVSAIKREIYYRGPIAAAVCVGAQFQQYRGGVFSTNETCQNSANHGIILVGWDDSRQVWRLRNSWGTEWGEGGYMWIRYGTSNVGYAANYIVYTKPFTPSHWIHLPLVVRN